MRTVEQFSASEIAEWKEYDKLSPIGPKRADLLTAHLMQLIRNVVAAATGNDAKPLSDYIIYWDAQEHARAMEEKRLQESGDVESQINLLKVIDETRRE